MKYSLEFASYLDWCNLLGYTPSDTHSLDTYLAVRYAIKNAK